MVTLLALAMTVGAVLVAVLAIVAVAVLGHFREMLPTAPAFVVTLGKVLSYVAMSFAGAAGAATLYRYGPSREKQAWVWLTAGSVFAALCWLVLTFGFGLYVSSLGNYNATYGSLGAVVVLLTWLWLSSYILLFGAEINSELERKAEPGGVIRSPKSAREGIGLKSTAFGTNGTDQDRHPPLLKLPTAQSSKGRQLKPLVTDFIIARATSKLTSAVGFAQIDLVSTGLATLGQALIRRKGRAAQGLILIGIAAGVGWISKERD